MDRQELYTSILEDNKLTKTDAIAFMDERIEFSRDKAQCIETISNAIDKLSILCIDLKLEIRLHSANPLIKAGNQQLFTTKKAAEILGVSPSKVRDLANKGFLKNKKISKTDWRISSASLEAYKSQLSELIMLKNEVNNYDTISIVNAEMQKVEILISAEGIRKVFIYQTRIKRKIHNIFDSL